MPNSGLTLLEVIITLALVTSIAGLGLFWSKELVFAEDLEGETTLLATLIMRERDRALSGYENALCYDQDRHAFVSSQGESPLGRGTSVLGMPSCGERELSFSLLSATTVPASITLLKDGRERSVLINGQGFMEW